MQHVVRIENGYAIVFPDGRQVTVTMAGHVAKLGEGWVAMGATIDFTPVILLHLIHIEGMEATWFLDQKCQFIGGNINALCQNAGEEFTNSIRTKFSIMVTRFLTDPHFGEEAGDRVLFDIDEQTRTSLFSLCNLELIPDFRSIDTVSCDEISVLVESDRHPLLREMVAKATSVNPEAAYFDACRSGKMTWPSPVDGQAADNVRGFVLAHILIVWRCVDLRNSLVFFVVAKGFGNQTITVLMPENRLIHGLPGSHLSSPATNARDIRILVNHFLLHGRDVVSFIRRPVAGVAHFMWGENAVHVGHYHCNELSGLEQILSGLERCHYPIIYDMAGAADGNFYGSLSNLFPELGAKVDLSCSTFKQMSSHAYARGIQIVRFGGWRVSALIRDRIAMAIGMTTSAQKAREINKTATGPVVVFGLRVENRTFTNPVEFYATLARAIVNKYGKATIIVDGHNTKAGQAGESFASYMESRAVSRPIDIERRILADLKSSLADENVDIVDCIGMTLLDNLAWMSIADYCVAPWGAGLAKYRWALNLPSYILINNFCKRGKSDIDIYHSVDFMESPTKLSYCSEQLITDRPDIPVLVNIDDANKPFFVNYDIDIEAVVGEIISQIPVRVE